MEIAHIKWLTGDWKESVEAALAILKAAEYIGADKHVLSCADPTGKLIKVIEERSNNIEILLQNKYHTLLK